MRRRVFTAVLAAGLAALSGGCVERRFVVESNPPGAMVLVNNVPYGPTPVDIPFLYYGNYDIQLVKDGYQTKTVKQNIATPFYERVGIDFISEVLLPVKITDVRPLYYELDPVVPPNLDQLKIDADELRRRGKELPPPRYPDIDKNQKPRRGGQPPASARPPGTDSTFPVLPRDTAPPPPAEPLLPPLALPPS